MIVKWLYATLGVLYACITLGQNTYTLSGYVYDETTGEAQIGALVYHKGLQMGVSTNEYGFYAINLPEGMHAITFSSMGFKDTTVVVELKANRVLNCRMAEEVNVTQVVVIDGHKQKLKDKIQSTEMGKVDIPMSALKKVPMIAGESDVVKALQLTPGIKRGTEGTVGMYVRGGGADQNLILLDEATVYNAGHLLGFFSTFNTNSIKDVLMYKSAYPSYYGGRLSSVMDVRMKEGNMQKYQTEGGVGLISSNITVQGPLKKDTASFILSGRRTYLDQVFKLVGQQLPYYFYDLNGKINYRVSARDRLYLSSYYGKDVLKFAQEAGDSSVTDFKTNSDLGNATVSLRWNHTYNDSRIFSNTSLIYSRFKYEVGGTVLGNSVYVKSYIQDFGLKQDYTFNLNAKNELRFGGSWLSHTFRPNILSATGDISNVLKERPTARLYCQEWGVYAHNDFNCSVRWKINYGMRLSGALVKGKAYVGLEPRLAARYKLNEKSSLKASYTRMTQYLHLVSSSSVALPTDLWYPVTRQIRPQSSDQLSLGYYRLLEKYDITLSTELYYKWMHNLIEYREGAVLFLNENYERELVRGHGNAYGVELFVQKTQGKFSGWVGYTLSWSTRLFDSLNRGERFYSKYDRRNDVSVVASYDMGKRVSLSIAWVYSSGNPFTARVGQLLMPNPSFTSLDVLPIYTSRGAVRLSSSHRLDIDLVVKRKPTRKWQGEWHFSVYNLYNRTQPAYVGIVSDNQGGFKYQQTGIFGAIPTVAYNFKF